MPTLLTDRLRITPFSLACAEAARNDRAALAALLDATVPDAWPLADIADLLPSLVEARRANPADDVWSGLIVHRADRVLIGDIGFKGGPDKQGAVEIGYSIIPAYRRRGLASEAARAMIAWAFTQPGVMRVIAECLPDNTGSVRVLENAGLHRTGTRLDHEEGLLLTWAVDAALCGEDGGTV